MVRGLPGEGGGGWVEQVVNEVAGGLRGVEGIVIPLRLY